MKKPVRKEGAHYYTSSLDLDLIPPTLSPHGAAVAGGSTPKGSKPSPPHAHLKQPSVHQPRTLIVLTMIRVLGYTLSLVCYHRQLISHARRTTPPFSEMARLLAYLFSPLRLDSS